MKTYSFDELLMELQDPAALVLSTVRRTVLQDVRIKGAGASGESPSETGVREPCSVGSQGSQRKALEKLMSCRAVVVTVSEDSQFPVCLK